MVESVLGKKVGMTQVFDADGKVVPVTVVNIANLVVTQVKSPEKDGYSSLQLGLLRKRYHNKPYADVWLKNKKRFFVHVKEVNALQENTELAPGHLLTLDNVAFEQGQKVSVTSRSKGLGFQGVVKRWGFAGGPRSHGSKSHRRPGSIGNMRTQGEVCKGKKSPGHAGARQVTVKGLKVVHIDKDNNCLFIKGAIPGKKNSLILVKKQGSSS